ncbi:MAG TPA: histone deacetylase [bacterium]|nr:histone deacetylase [bacterium]
MAKAGPRFHAAPGLLFVHPDYRRHLTPTGHPERPARLEAVEARLQRTPLWEALPRRTPEPVSDEVLTTVHTRAHVARVRDLAASGGGALDPDTAVGPASDRIARLAAGGALAAVDAALAGEAPVAMALVRPPGHHARPNAGMGFCLFNNVALAARHALERRGVDRVFILDWDVHHGNGTQEAFYHDPRVVFCSLHQENWYPGTGPREETGEGPGEGATVNIPLPAGVGDGGYEYLWEEVVLPLLRAVAPGLLLISAGFDAHHADPLGGMLLTAAGFGRLSAMVREAAGTIPIAAVLEGGYDLDGLSYSVAASLSGLTGVASDLREPEAALREAPFPVARERARETRRIAGMYWAL